MKRFSRVKFCQLTPEQQHKHLAKLLKEALTDPAVLATYTEWAGWIDLPALVDLDDRYHEHLAQSGRGYKEHEFLIRTQDLREPKAPPLQVQIYLDGIRSAHNVGSILRTTEAFQLGELYFSSNMASPSHKQVRDASMGSADHVICHENVALEELPAPVICLETAEGATPLYEMRWPETFTLVLGNEERGCSDKSLSLATEIVQIPLVGRKNSLNVACAFAIVASHIRSQSPKIPKPEGR